MRTATATQGRDAIHGELWEQAIQRTKCLDDAKCKLVACLWWRVCTLPSAKNGKACRW